MTTKPENFYLDTNDNVFKKCPNECASCIMSSGSVTCSTCNNIDEYYSIQGNSSQCVQPPQPGYYLDLISGSLQQCYNLCEECKGGYSSIEHNCTRCKTGYREQPLKENNCIKECDFTVSYWYLDDNNIYKCTSGLHCPESRPIFEWHNNNALKIVNQVELVNIVKMKIIFYIYMTMSVMKIVLLKQKLLSRQNVC